MNIHIQVTRGAAPPGGAISGRGILRKSLIALALTVALSIAVAGAAIATIPDGTGEFHGCVANTSGNLRIIDPSAGQSCNGAEQAVSWSETGIHWKGPWSSSATYLVRDAVSYRGSSYIATAAGAGGVPGESAQWSLMVSQGRSGYDGNTVLHGAGAPPNAQGSHGDFYIDATNHVLFGSEVPLLRQPELLPGLAYQGSATGWRDGIGRSRQHLYQRGEHAGRSSTVRRHGRDDASGPAGEYYLSANINLENADESTQDASCELYVNYDNSLTGKIDAGTTTLPAAPSDGEGYAQMVLRGTVQYGSPGWVVVACNTFRGGVISAHLSALQTGTVLGGLG